MKNSAAGINTYWRELRSRSAAQCRKFFFACVLCFLTLARSLLLALLYVLAITVPAMFAALLLWQYAEFFSQLVAVLIPLSLVAAIICKAFFDNRNAMRQLGTQWSARLFFKATIHWIPSLVLLAPVAALAYSVELGMDWVIAQAEEYAKATIELIPRPSPVQNWFLSLISPKAASTFDEITKEAPVWNRTVFWTVRTAASFLTVHAWIYFSFVTALSYGCILARVAATEGVCPRISFRMGFFLSTSALFRRASIDLEMVDHATFSEASQDDFYLQRKAEPIGMHPRACCPKPWATPIARFIHGSYFMNRVPVKRLKDVSLTPKKGCKLVVCTLKPGAELCFFYDGLVGFSDDLKLKTIVNFEIGAVLALGVFYSVATGPGTLIFETEGEPLIMRRTDQETRSFPTSRLIAWDRATEFKVDASDEALDYYVSNVYIRPAQPAALLLNADLNRPKGSVISGMWNAGVKLLKPF